LGLVLGFIIALLLGKVDFDGLQDASWFAMILPFKFGVPRFELWSIVTLTVVMLIVFIESMGMFLAWAKSSIARSSVRIWYAVCGSMLWEPCLVACSIRFHIPRFHRISAWLALPVSVAAGYV
jgi:hypothetical protein